jgi:hypothetical protein
LRLSKAQRDKSDTALRKALQNAEGDEVLRSLMVLGEDDTSSEAESDIQYDKGELDPSQFFSRVEYRSALIEKQQEKTTRHIGPTMQALYDLSLRPVGGTISKAVAVEGPARQIAAALKLPGVRHAILD